MAVGVHGQNLVFLISQPRAGSTLLQRILGKHPEVHTVAEPWLMLPLLGVMRGRNGEPDTPIERTPGAIRAFLQTFPDGEEAYLEGVRNMAGHLYACALEHSGRRLFLDKTPRYYQIIPELLGAFAEARFIFLLRNPLAVLHSIVEAWTGWSWLNLSSHRADLLDAPDLLIEGIEAAGCRGVSLRYESLVQQPETEVASICRHLEIDFDAEIVDYGGGAKPGWGLGDQDELWKNRRPVGSSIDRWTRSLVNAQSWRVAHDYLHELGPATVEALGYGFTELADTVARHRPGPLARRATMSLAWLLARPARERSVVARATARLMRRHLGPASKSDTDSPAGSAEHALSEPR
jgi:hypothetical protein